jgi:hypothetical protein
MFSGLNVNTCTVSHTVNHTPQEGNPVRSIDDTEIANSEIKNVNLNISPQAYRDGREDEVLQHENLVDMSTLSIKGTISTETSVKQCLAHCAAALDARSRGREAAYGVGRRRIEAHRERLVVQLARSTRMIGEKQMEHAR